MSYILLLISSLGAAAVSYLMCEIIEPGACLSVSLGIGFLVGGFLFFMFPPVAHSTDANTIIVGTSGDFPPFALAQDDGSVVGFDIDVINEVGARLNKTIVLKNMPFSTLLPSLQMGNFHVIVAGLSSTPERAKRVLFSKPYLEGVPLLIVSLNTAPAKTLDDLRNKEVIVNEGYTADTYLSNIGGMVIKRLKTPAEAFLALKTGRFFAFVTPQNTLKPFFDQYGSADFTVVPIPNTGENTSLAIAPQYPELLKEIQGALDSMHKDGFIQALKVKWGLS